MTEPFPTDNSAVSVISLAIHNPPEGTECRVSGWGALGDGRLPSILQEVEVPFISYDKCKQIYSDTHNDSILPGMVCAGYEEGGRDACGVSIFIPYTIGNSN